ncbi:hypothetical protein KCMC57_up36530 [Kitasatospora sp. CMC57]|uniref:Uncharacterized protein n=1 Tax=Kitasatospora sp. CMC57 TaxID=3231513 RepID=A0AB33K0M5_9ACTN
MALGRYGDWYGNEEVHGDAAGGAGRGDPCRGGVGGFSRYVAQAIERQRERDHLHEFVGWWEGEHGAVSDAELALAEAERVALQREHSERKARSVPHRKAG